MEALTITPVRGTLFQSVLAQYAKKKRCERVFVHMKMSPNHLYPPTAKGSKGGNPICGKIRQTSGKTETS